MKKLGENGAFAVLLGVLSALISSLLPIFTPAIICSYGCPSVAPGGWPVAYATGGINYLLLLADIAVWAIFWLGVVLLVSKARKLLKFGVPVLLGAFSTAISFAITSHPQSGVEPGCAFIGCPDIHGWPWGYFTRSYSSSGYFTLSLLILDLVFWTALWAIMILSINKLRRKHDQPRKS